MSGRAPAVIFDLDGTLLDSMPLVLQAYAHALKPFHPPLSDDAWRAQMGGPPERIFRKILQDGPRVSGALARLEECAPAFWERIAPFAGMVELLRDLRGEGLKIGIWTGRERESTEWLLRQHAIAGLVQAAVCGDDLDSHKPDPDGLAALVHQLGVRRDESWFVGDAAVDVQAGSTLGIRTLLISHGLALADTVTARAWRVVDTPAEAYAAIRAELIHRPGVNRRGNSVT